MKKIFTLISMAFVAMSVNAQTPESYVAVDADGNMSAEYAAIVDAEGKATNVENGNSVVKFGTTNVSVEGVSSGVPADKVDPDDPTANIGQDITIGNVIDADTHTYELISINSTKPIAWQLKSQGDINFSYIQGSGIPAVSTWAQQNSKDGDWVDNAYSVKYEAFDPAVGGLPVTGLYYKITTKVDGALKIGMFANKGGHGTYVVDSDTKQVSEFLVEGYINGQNWKTEDVTAGKCTEDQVGKKKWLTHDEIKALHDAGTIHSSKATYPWIIGDGNQHFWGNVVVDAKANKTYYFFQGTTQPGFQGYTFAPGKSKEDLTGVESIKTVAEKATGARYNLAGQKVDSTYKGVVIQNGKKMVVK
jgi:hypothetical protein